MLDNDSIEKVEFLSNLNIYIKGEKYHYFCNDFNFEKKYDNDYGDYNGTTFEINGKFFIYYYYMRGGSTTTVYDLNDNYKKVYSKSYYHEEYDLSFIKHKYLILPPSFDDYDLDYDKYTFVNLEDFSERLIETYYSDFRSELKPNILYKFKEEKYLQFYTIGRELDEEGKKFLQLYKGFRILSQNNNIL